MPRYFFDVTDDQNSLKDLDGSELPSVEYARDEAIAIVAELSRNRQPQPSHIKVEVRDEFDQPLTVARLTVETAR